MSPGGGARGCAGAVGSQVDVCEDSGGLRSWSSTCEASYLFHHDFQLSFCLVFREAWLPPYKPAHDPGHGTLFLSLLLNPHPHPHPQQFY